MNLIEEEDCTLGVRPTDIEIGAGDLHATVDLVESLGAEALIHLDLDGKALLAQVPEPISVEVGSTIALQFKKVHRFDQNTGTRL